MTTPDKPITPVKALSARARCRSNRGTARPFQGNPDKATLRTHSSPAQLPASSSTFPEAGPHRSSRGMPSHAAMPMSTAGYSAR